MESITKSKPGEALEQTLGLFLNSWERIVQVLPDNLAASAVEQKAIERLRGIRSAEDLIHAGLAYSVLDKSLTELGSWASQQGIADISAPAWYEHLCAARQWMGWLLVQFLEQRQLRLPKGRAVTLDIRDATVISRPGSQGTDWRIHLALDLGAMGISGVELTDAKGGESLVRFAGAADRIVLADRIHANRKGLNSLLERDASFVIRLAWSTLPLQDEQGQPWSVTDWLGQAFADPQTVFQEHSVYLRGSAGSPALRVCAVRLSKEAAELAVQRARKQAKKNGHTPDERTLLVAQFVIVVTNLSAQLWNAEQVLELYRVRWQIELFFKRLKSILLLDQLRAKKSKLAQTYLLCKLLAACLLDCLSQRFRRLLPDGFSTLQRPLSYWSLTRQLWEYFQAIIRGPLLMDQFFANPQQFQRFLRNPPRKRIQQLAWVLDRLDSIARLPPSPLSNGLS